MYDSLRAQAIPLEKVEALRHDIADLFAINDTTLDRPHPGQVRFRGYFLRDPAEHFDELRRRFEQHGFTPLVRQEEGRLALIALPVVFEAQPSNWLINLVLFIATVASTLLVGSGYAIDSPEGAVALLRGWPFSLSIMLILGAHELGHYFAARYHKVPVTLPYFIPLPLSIIGTLGAFIRLKAPVKNKRALLDVGAAGPLAGLVFALPILFYGLLTSEVGPSGALPGQVIILEGNSILYALAKLAVFGQFLPGDGLDVHLNMFAWAGWIGLLVTGLNLFPVGQLDGGHIAYVLFGKRARRFFWPVLIGLAALMLLTEAASMWGLWIVLLFFLGRTHAEPLDDVTPLDGKRRLVAIFTLLLFFLVFVPVPLRFISS